MWEKWFFKEKHGELILFNVKLYKLCTFYTFFQDDQQGFCVWKRMIWKDKNGSSTMKKSQSVDEESEEKKKDRPMCSVWFENKPNYNPI